MIGSTIIPLWERLTILTISTCFSIVMLRWRIPIPPSRARAMARLASVTVSIAALTMGMLRGMLRVSLVCTLASLGSTVDLAGTRSTSSNVRASNPYFRCQSIVSSLLGSISGWPSWTRGKEDEGVLCDSFFSPDTGLYYACFRCAIVYSNIGRVATHP